MLEEREDGLYNVKEDGEEIIIEDYNDGYYHIFQDAYKYQDANVIIVYSRRGPGKTTGALLGALLRGKTVMYIKRTIADVKMITKATDEDLSPWATINRLKGTNYMATPVKGVDGFAVVVQHDTDNKPIEESKPIGYICALSAAGKIKGFDLSDKIDIMIVDEFVPSKGVIAKKGEGDQTLDILATLMRDRHRRGLPDIKLWLLSNCDYLACPITRTLCLLDEMYELSSKGESYYYNNERKILLHHILKDEYPEATNKNIFNFMLGTDWYKRNMDGDFDEDFSNIENKQSLKNYKCISIIKYNNRDSYILLRDSDNSFYITYDFNSRISKDIPRFNFNYENDIRLFYCSSMFSSLLQSLMLNKVKFSSYSLYDLFKRYHDIFNDNIY